jgi:hypothetical protein
VTLALRVVPALDRLVRHRVITGYTVERDVSYLAARGPTLTYRMYDDGPGSRHLASFTADMRRLGGEVRVAAAVGNFHDPAARGRIHRTRQATVTARFATPEALEAAVAVVRTRYRAGRAGAVPGSWRWPDVRVTGGSPRQGMALAVAHWASFRRGSPVTLTLGRRSPLPGLHQAAIWVLDEWRALLGSEAL